jgi:hypothetical protein
MGKKAVGSVSALGRLTVYAQPSADFLAPLKKRGISISMDGRGRSGQRFYSIERLG